MDGTKTQTRGESSFGSTLPLSLIPQGQEWIPDLVPRPDGIRCSRGVLLGVALSLPFWLRVWWAVVSL